MRDVTARQQEMKPYVAMRDGRPVGTLHAASDFDANSYAWACYEAWAYPKATFPWEWEIACARECRAEHASRGESRASRAVSKAMEIIRRIGLP